MTTFSTIIESPSPHRIDASDVGDGSALALSPFKVSPWWPKAPAPQFKPYVLEALVAVVALGLLLAFFQVVHQSVLRGEQLRQAVAVHSAATHHCKSLAALGSGDACLRLLNAPATAGLAQANSMVSVSTR